MKSVVMMFTSVCLVSGTAWSSLQPASTVQPAQPIAAGNERTLTCEVIVDAALDEVWEAFTTKAGIESWMVPLAEVDFRIGSTIKTNYNKEAGIGGPGTIVHHILAYEPHHMLAMRFDAPPEAGDKKLAENTWVITRMEPISANQTRVTESMVGWGTGPEWDKVYEFFEKGNAWTLGQLKKKFAKPAHGGFELTQSLVEGLVGGEWIAEDTINGKTFRVRNVLEHGPDGKSILTRGWLGGSDGMWFHALTMIRPDADAGRYTFHGVNQDGLTSEGDTRATAERVLAWGWNTHNADGSVTRLDIQMEFAKDNQSYRMVMRPAGNPTATPIVDVALTRVPRAPEVFFRMKDSSSKQGVNVTRPIEPSLFPVPSTDLAPVVKEVLIPGSPAEVFHCWTTSEGFKSFMSVESNIELRVGGKFEIYFSMDPPAGLRGSEGCQVLAYIPDEMLAFSWSAPPKFPKEREQRALVVVTMMLAEGGTKVRLVHTGFGEGGQWPEVRQYFDNAWGMVLGALTQKFAPASESSR